jgi:hypothetical protein
MAFESKIESYYKQTNQVTKLAEFQRAKQMATTMLEIASGHASSVDQSMADPIS